MTYSYSYKKKSTSWRQQYPYLESLNTDILAKATTVIIYALVLFVGTYYLLRRSNILPPNAIQKFIWRGFIYAIPPSIVLALESKEQQKMNDPLEFQESYAGSRTIRAKSQAIKRILGLGSGSLISHFRQAGTAMDLSAMESKRKSESLPGLFNRDNECYQNSVIQGLASLESFRGFVRQLPSPTPESAHTSLTGALQTIIEALNDSKNNGRSFWTPWALKNMSSWQQQDAQEYYSRVIDEVEKDAAVSSKPQISPNASLSLCLTERDRKGESRSTFPSQNVLEYSHPASGAKQLSGQTDLPVQNPLEGLQAQRVGCLQCGFVEGLSLIPFNCLTVSLGRESFYDIENLLDMCTDLERIPGVECAQCTLLRQKYMFEQMLKSRTNGAAPEAQDEGERTAHLKAMVRSRLQVVQIALDERDFSETTLTKKCNIPSRSRLTTDKTKQSVIARPPHSLTLHVNRSVFDEYTGTQLKNYARVRFPKLLDLSPWCLGSDISFEDGGIEIWELNPSLSMIPGSNSSDGSVSDDSDTEFGFRGRGIFYALRAVITHYGTHGDGHYIAYRQSPESTISEGNGTTSNPWWRISDDDVFQVDEEVVLAQGGVFMLFYERIEGHSIQTPQTGSTGPREDDQNSPTSSTPSSVCGSTAISDPTQAEHDDSKSSSEERASPAPQAFSERAHDVSPRASDQNITSASNNPSDEASPPSTTTQVGKEDTQAGPVLHTAVEAGPSGADHGSITEAAEAV